MSTRAWRSTAALVAILVIVTGVGATAVKASACPAHVRHPHVTKPLVRYGHHAHRHHRRHHKPRLTRFMVVGCPDARIGIWAPAGTCDEPWHYLVVVKR